MADSRITEGPKPFSPDNEKHVASRKRQAERDERRAIEALRWVMSDARGRLAMEQIVTGTGVYENAFAGDPTQTHFNCGRQAEGRKLLDKLEELFPVEFLQMETERLQTKVDARTKDEVLRTESATSEPGEEKSTEGET